MHLQKFQRDYVSLWEKRGKTMPEAQMEQFKIFLSDNNLYEVDYIGNKFTWSNKLGADSFTKKRLDIMLANSQ